MSWVDRAACLGDDDPGWTASEPGSTNRSSRAYLDYLEWIAPLRDGCNACPVQQECLDDAMSVSEYYAPDGLRGGLTRSERVRLKRRQARERRRAS